MEKSGIILDVRGLSCGYGATMVLTDVSFTARDGEIIGIIGPNGSGKTTLIRAVTKVIVPKEGSVIFNNRSVHDMSYAEVAKNIAVVSQMSEDPMFLTTVEENVLMGRVPHFSKFQWIEDRHDIRIAEESMRLVDVMDLRKKPVNEISGGERQRALIARALAQRPKLLLMDEPTAQLDINHRIEIFELMKDLIGKGGPTVICVLHDINLASKYCSRLILLNAGRVACQGSPTEIITKGNIKKIYKADLEISRDVQGKYPQVLY